MEEYVELLLQLSKVPTNEFEATEQAGAKRRLEELTKEFKTTNNDVDDEGGSRADIALLTPSADSTQIANKINELINAFNKYLRDYRI